MTLHCEDNRITDVDLHPYRITDDRAATARPAATPRTSGGRWRPSRRRSRPPSGPARAWQAYLAYYGVAGFTSEVQGILDRMTTEPQKAAAMFRNRITTMQHAELWRECLTRDHGRRDADVLRATRTRLVEEYFTKKA